MAITVPVLRELLRRRRCWRRWTHDEEREDPLPVSRATKRPRASHSQSYTVLYTSTSFRTLPLVYAMMESQIRTEAEHRAGRRRSGLCRGGPGNGLAGFPDISARLSTSLLGGSGTRV